MRKLASVVAVFVLAVLPGCGGGDDVDVNPGGGDGGVGEGNPGEEEDGGEEEDDGY